MRAAILEVDTDVYLRTRESRNSEILKKILQKYGIKIVFEKVLPSDREVLSEVIKRITTSGVLEMIFTIGGIGVSRDDIVPDATKDVLEVELPGMAEAIRAYGRKVLADCSMTRETAGIYENTLIVNLSEETEWMADCAQHMMPEFIQGVKIIADKRAK